MNYALIENGVVVNMIWLLDSNSNEFPSAVKAGKLPVRIGDTYENGKFYRDGVEVVENPDPEPSEPVVSLEEQLNVAYQEGVNEA